MRLFHLTAATIFQRKSWFLCLVLVLVLPFALPWISSAEEKPVLLPPARIQAAWACLWLCTLLWAFFTASHQGESNARSGIGEYFLTTGKSPTRQLLEIWLAVFSFLLPLVLAAAAITYFAARPSHPDEQAFWPLLTFQYSLLFLLAIAPLHALAIAIASRYGGIAGFAFTLGLTLYGLYGVGYLDNLLKQEENPFLQALWLGSPQYRLADLTQRLYFKTGALPSSAFLGMIGYFAALATLLAGLSRLLFRANSLS